MIGNHLGHYEVVSELGRGGMGEVYRARDTKLGREVAIKVLPSEFAQDSERVARLEREARMLAALNHPNIAAIYGLEQQDETRFLVLELVEGDTLADSIGSGPVPVADSLKLALQITEALEAAHEKGVIHRDLKPANIKVTPDGKVKVLDFGLAKAFSGEQGDVNLSNSPTLSMQATQQGVVLGTAGYMSPEQASGEVADKRADIWSFGVVLFEMLTGRQLFSGKTISHVLADVLKTDPDWTQLPANVHPRLRLLLERLLEKDPKDRLSGISDARVEIQKVLGDPGGVTPQPVAEVQDSATQSKMPWVAAVLLAVLVGGAVWMLRPAAEPGPVARFPFVLPEGQNFTRPESSMIALSPDGTRIAYVANGQIYVRNLDETESRPVDGTAEGLAGVSSPVFSPDGEWLAYVHVQTATESVVRRVPVTGGTPVTVLDQEGFEAELAWPDEDSIVMRTGEGVVRVPAGGGAPELLVAVGDDETLSGASILPGGDRVLFAIRAAAGEVQWDTARIYVQSIGEDDRTLVWEGGSDPRYLPSGHLVYAQGDTLFALPFDPDTGQVSGGPVPMVEGVRRSSSGVSSTGNYAVSDTGTLVSIPGGAAAASPAGVLSMVDRNGDVRGLDVPPAQYRSPRVSPDGRQLAVEIIGDDGQGHIWIYDLTDGSDIRRLTQTGNNTRPIWTPDGERVTFGSERDGEWGVFERPVDGSTLAERLTTAGSGRRQWPDSWSPDGQTLVFADAGLAMAAWDLWTYSVDGGSAEVFADGPDNEMYAALSPDGEWVVYTQTGDPFGVRAQPFPPTGVVLQITENNETGPVWTSAGDELFFRMGFQAAATPTQLSGMEVTTEGAFTFRNQRDLPIEGALMFQGYRDYDVTPDGQEFVMIYPIGETDAGDPAPADRIDVVLNWIEELKERVPVE